MAYGTNIGNAFKNYDPSDFTLEKNIGIKHKDCEIVDQGNNKIQCKILGRDFKISFYKFDPFRELKIEIEDEK